LASVTRPGRPRPEPETGEPGGEPPAVAGFLTEGFEVPDEAVPATLLDLAGRGHLEVEQIGPTTAIRVREPSGADPLAPHERRVLDHVRGLARDGLLPAEALATGPEALSDAWWRGFRAEVIEEARSRGLSRPRWQPWQIGALWAGVALSFGLLWLSVEVGERAPESIRPTVPSAAALVGGLAAAAVVHLLTSSRRERDTAAGLEAAGRWLGVRRHLSSSSELEDQPPGAVVVFGRSLAYAAAMGLAPAAVRGLPLGREDDRRAWSRASGRWRRTTVRYPRFRPGYGFHPAVAVGAGAIRGGAAGFVARFAFDLGLAPDLADIFGQRAGAWVGQASLVVGVLATAAAAWNLVVFVFGLADLFASTEVRGVLLRRRAFGGVPRMPGSFSSLLAKVAEAWAQQRDDRRLYVAVDTGAADEVVAWRVRPVIHDAAAQGSMVRAVVSPRLRYVRSIETIPG